MSQRGVFVFFHSFHWTWETHCLFLWLLWQVRFFFSQALVWCFLNRPMFKLPPLNYSQVAAPSLFTAYSSTTFLAFCDASPLISDPVLTRCRLGGGRGGSPAWPGHLKGQRQQCQLQWLPRGPGALYCTAHTPGASPCGERDASMLYSITGTSIENFEKKMQSDL